MMKKLKERLAKKQYYENLIIASNCFDGYKSAISTSDCRNYSGEL